MIQGRTLYDFRCTLLSLSEPSDIIVLVEALGSGEMLTLKERKKYLPLFTLLFKENGPIIDLCKRRVNITIICKYMDELQEIYKHNTARQIRDFDILLVLTKSYKVVTPPPGLMNELLESTVAPLPNHGSGE